ncbi:DUF2924 domain-containing protein [Altererythrobacter ishigakiensis]|uniref:DUF2924 family protein n=1 Tax=Altererythrobacter ishigakiensis TaxID=476157 RepID=A0A562UM17_9SPHN|nr:DUF2924 domain-containing protein [Altererythrobacter ishigakiensis]TWJ06626.1 Protein of unknown function (DUF2924) [Altererythrobacter ishigakiensis]
MSTKSKLAEELAALDDMNTAELAERWVSLTARPLPKVSAALLRLALAWELQVAVHGGLSRQSLQRLEQLAAGKTQTQSLAPGMRLAREYGGKLHVVVIDEDGAIHWNGRTWKSLSAVARAITGTRWSGPAFFGLKQKRQAA